MRIAVWLVLGLSLFLRPALGTSVVLPAGACHSESILVPYLATNLTIEIECTQGAGPLTATLCRQGDSGCHSLNLASAETQGQLALDAASTPPLNPGTYDLRLCNAGSNEITATVTTSLAETSEEIRLLAFTNPLPAMILDQETSRSTIYVPNHGPVIGVEAGVRIAHPHISDLELSLVSPWGTRVLLAKNRGGASTEGMGRDNLFTNTVPFSAEGGPAVYTNVINTGVLAGTIHMDWSFYSIGDRMVVYHGTEEIMDTGLVSWSGSTNLVFGPGASTLVTIVMNPGDNPEPDTAWDYTIQVSMAEHVHAVFTENTNKTLTSIAYAVPPFTNANYIGNNGAYSEGIFYLSEGDLSLFIGEDPAGSWELEMVDTVTGYTSPAAVLLSWELLLDLENPVPNAVTLPPEQQLAIAVAPGAMLSLAVAAPIWAARATNLISNSSADVNLWFSQAGPPTGNGAGDHLLMAGVRNSSTLLQAGGTPPLIPGNAYFLGVQNTNPIPVTLAIAVAFDATGLSNGVPATRTLAATPMLFYFDVTTNETAVSFQLSHMTANADLFVGKTPYPSPQNFEAASRNSGERSEEVILTPGSFPPLAPGRWYAGIYGPSNTTFELRTIAFTNPLPPMVTLASGSPHSTTNSAAAGETNDYYRFVVTTNALRAEFELTGISGELALAVHKGLPPPDLSSWDFFSSSPGTNDERIVVLDCSQPVSLAAGEWFIAVVNTSGNDAAYTIKATEWAARGEPIELRPPEVHDGVVCLTWNSLPGVSYYISGTEGLGSPDWVAVSPSITASELSTTYCLSLPGPSWFFRVCKGLAPEP